ncbi:hypothetical protein OG897_25535 [Streptomyces sp. NBC_00237]|uniref:hypothetical protein n=1 Tax=Streptomyces sp. NBC_00237 TaxID=2975687 RepID=UPI00225A7B66|nr:hypothetical protein [Streptomyces sp. NBC_00237]MCX5204805.1 hypothetical protein [Streptomyces sp. NBC_00237]
MTGAGKRGVWVLLVAVALFAVVVLPQILSKDDDDRPSRAAGVSLGVPKKSDVEKGATGASGGGGGGPVPGSSGSGKGAGEASEDGEEPDEGVDRAAIGAAFAAARAGDCLALFDTGDGWNTRIPQKVGCAGDAGLTRVSAVRTGWSACPTGDGQSYVVHRTDQGKKVLCLTRQYKAGYCVLAEKGAGADGGTMRLGSMTAVECKAKKLAKPYDTVLHITGVYGPGSGRTGCSRAVDDRTLYWFWKVNGGGTLLCTMVYRG